MNSNIDELDVNEPSFDLIRPLTEEKTMNPTSGKEFPIQSLEEEKIENAAETTVTTTNECDREDPKKRQEENEEDQT